LATNSLSNKYLHMGSNLEMVSEHITHDLRTDALFQDFRIHS